MANSITAGNSSNGGTAIVTDTSGTLEIKTGTGSGTTAISIDASQNVTIAGTISASGGVSGGIRSGTAVASTSGTSIDFTGIPTGVKRITVMFNNVSTNGTSFPQIQIGSGSIVTSGYSSFAAYVVNSAPTSASSATTGFHMNDGLAASTRFGSMVITNITGNTWVSNHTMGDIGGVVVFMGGGSLALSGVLDRVRITTVNGTDTFDAGSINILYE